MSIPSASYSSGSVLRFGYGDWTASVHIEFTEKLTVRTIVLKAGDAFKSEVQAREFIIDETKQWVDDRLASARVVQRRKHIS